MFRYCLIFPLALVVLFVCSCRHKVHSASDYEQILKQFEQWKQAQYKKGTYADEQHCNSDTVNREGYKGSIAGLGQDMSITFTDINNDKKPDALVRLSTYICNNKNALVPWRWILILSDHSTYTTDDTCFKELYDSLHKASGGWMSIQSVSFSTFYGTYYSVDSVDKKHSFTKHHFTIDYKTKKLTFEEWGP